MKLAFAAYALFALTFSYFQVRGDGLVYFNLLRRFFGEKPDFAFAYQFGSAVWNAPFFLVGKALGIAFGFQPRIFHVSFEEIGITFAAHAALVLTLYLGWRILRELQLPRGPGVLFLTAFGTPLFFYVVFEPGSKHAVDTLALTAAVFAFRRTTGAAGFAAPLVLGVLAGWSVNIRWVNGVFFFALLCALLLQRRYRQTGVVAVMALLVAPLVLALPALRGVPYFVPSYFPPEAESVAGAAEPPDGWRPFGGGVVARSMAQAHDGVHSVSVRAAADDDGAYRDRFELEAGATATISVYVKGSAGETVRGSVESPIGTFLGYLGKKEVPLDGSWQRLSRVFTVGTGGSLRLTVTSQSGRQTFYVDSLRVSVVGRRESAGGWPEEGPRSKRSFASVSLAARVEVAQTGEIGADPDGTTVDYDSPLKNFDPAIPLKMLVSEHRGLFVWTPLTALAFIGFVLLLVRTYGSKEFRSFLAPLFLAATALLSTHVLWPQWDGGFAFSQRFLTGLFPLYLIGVAELVRRARFVAYPLLVASVAFALMVAFVHDVGYDGVSERDGIGRILEVADSNRDNLRRKVQTDAEDRWKYLWGLLHGRDSKCIHGPPDC